MEGIGERYDSEDRGQRAEGRFQTAEIEGGRCGVVRLGSGDGKCAMMIRSAKELEVYRKAYALAMLIFRISQRFPSEERYALMSQMRRSSRSVCTNLREAWAKRRHEAHFFSKLTDCDGENGETDTSLDFAKDCKYISPEEHADLSARTAEICRMLGAMIQDPAPFLIQPTRTDSDP